MSVLTAECAKSAESIPVFCFFPFRDFWVFRGEKWGKSINREGREDTRMSVLTAEKTRQSYIMIIFTKKWVMRMAEENAE